MPLSNGLVNSLASLIVVGFVCRAIGSFFEIPKRRIESYSRH